MDSLELARHNMIHGQLLPGDIVCPAVIGAIHAVPREMFLPSNYRGVAYADGRIPIGHGRYLPDVTELGRGLQAVGDLKDSRVLDIASGLGYTAAVLSKLCETVVTIESIPEFPTEVSRNVSALRLVNVIALDGQLQKGHSDGGPYDVIFVNGAVPKVPSVWAEQLKEGGKIILTLRQQDAPIGSWCIVTKSHGSLTSKYLADSWVPLLPEWNL